MLILSFALSVAAILGWRPPQLTVGRTGDGFVVTSVAVGSQAWINGIRPTMSALPWPGGRDGYDIDPGIGTAVGTDIRPPGPFAPTLLVGLALGLAALLVRHVGLPGVAVLSAGAAAVALSALYESVGLPTAYLLAPLPILVGILEARAGTTSGHRLLLALAAIGTTLGILDLASLFDDAPWRLIWMLPLVAGLAIPAIIALMAAWQGRSDGRPGARPGALLRDIVWSASPIERAGRLTGSELERERLATELHNDVLPQLDESIIALGATSAGPEVGDRLRGVGDSLRRLMLERQTVVLRAGGLPAAVEAVVAASISDRGPRMMVCVDDTGRARQDIELTGYRIAQAAIANARAYAGATSIRITVVTALRQVMVEVADDGIGFSMEPPAGRKARVSTGLADMRARAKDVGGQLDIMAPAGSGTTVRFRWTG